MSHLKMVSGTTCVNESCPSLSLFSKLRTMEKGLKLNFFDLQKV